MRPLCYIRNQKPDQKTRPALAALEAHGIKPRFSNAKYFKTSGSEVCSGVIVSVEEPYLSAISRTYLRSKTPRVVLVVNGGRASFAHKMNEQMPIEDAVEMLVRYTENVNPMDDSISDDILIESTMQPDELQAKAFEAEIDGLATENTELRVQLNEMMIKMEAMQTAIQEIEKAPAVTVPYVKSDPKPNAGKSPTPRVRK